MDGRGSAQRRNSSRPSRAGGRQSPRKSPGGRVRATGHQPSEPELPPEPEPAATNCHQPPATSPSPRGSHRGESPVASRGESPSRRPPIASQRAADARAAATFAEDDQRRAIDRFRPFIRVAAVSATARPTSPDYFRLGRHLAKSSASGVPREDPREASRAQMTDRRH